ncbi:hypothetical protein HanPSC8_Chr14g0595401 [Helianthus annuus]|nr:hypothetical protein HanIR_Chr14g0671281 [Helianthus annuus]KAJ0838488.1 hypothetical protein HanPSC8_Chr14g0595401 [Helianthus annuus]
MLFIIRDFKERSIDCSQVNSKFMLLIIRDFKERSIDCSQVNSKRRDGSQLCWWYAEESCNSD